MLEKSSNPYVRSFGRAVAAALILVPVCAVQAEETAGEIEEIMVTATYRDTRLMDTPLAISAVTAEEIDSKGIEDIQDLYKTIPGLSYRSQVASWNMLTVRGLSPTASGAAVVGVYFDNMPVTDSFPGGLRQTLGELFDMDRVEVLKGPQGTLYGEGNMGGSVRYITKKPDPSGFDFAAQANLENAAFSGGWSHKIDAMVNIPMGDRLALRVVGFRRDRKGVLDQIAPAGRDDVDTFEQSGGRAKLTWFATENLEVSLMANVTEMEVEGPTIAFHCYTESTVQSAVGLVPLYETPGTTCPVSQSATYEGSDPYVTHLGHKDYTNGGFDDQDMYNLNIDWELPFASLTASVSYIEREASFSEETSPGTVQSIAPFAGLFFGLPDTLSSLGPDAVIYRLSERWVQELRLVSNTDSRLQWTLGLYNKKEDVQDGRHSGCYKGGPPVYDTLPDAHCWLQWAFFDDAPLANQAALIGLFNAFVVPGNTLYSEFTEQAVFGELSYRFNDQWEALVGVRYASVENDLDVAPPGIDSRENPVNSLSAKTKLASPKFTLTWRPMDDWMVYGTVSQGFRPGVTNNSLAAKIAELDVVRAGNPTAEAHYERLVDRQGVDSDEVINYELGVKATVAEGRLSIIGAVYRIDWKDAIVQVSEQITDVPGVVPLLFFYDNNEGKAQSEGLELELRARLSDSLRLNIGADFNWTADILTGGSGRYFGTGIEAGNRLANAPKYSGFASLAWDFKIAGLDATARADGYWSGGKYFLATNQNLSPSSETLDLKVQFGRDNWQGALYVRNVTGEKSVFEVNTTGYRFGRPRTVGLQFSYRM